MMMFNVYDVNDVCDVNDDVTGEGEISCQRIEISFVFVEWSRS